MAKISLSDMTVQKLQPGIYYDTKTPAFGIRVGKRRRTWIVMKGRERSVLTLGHYPALSLKDARQSALRALSSPQAQKATISFPDALEAFLAQPRWRPGSKRVLQSSLRHFTWKRPLQKITYEDVDAALSAIPGRSARAHALKDIRTFFNWCVPRYLQASPATGLKMEPQPSRDRVLTDEELKAVWIAAEQMGQFGVIVKLLILSGQRRGEIGSLQKSWLHDDRLTLPASITKNGREHSLPLSPLAISLLTQLSSRTSPFSAWSKSHAQLLKISGTSGWTIHDIRRSVATGLASLGVRQEVTEKILNHASGKVSGVAAIYNRHSYFEEMREALTRWEERVLSIARQ